MKDETRMRRYILQGRSFNSVCLPQLMCCHTEVICVANARFTLTMCTELQESVTGAPIRSISQSIVYTPQIAPPGPSFSPKSGVGTSRWIGKYQTRRKEKGTYQDVDYVRSIIEGGTTIFLSTSCPLLVTTKRSFPKHGFRAGSS